jgi:hypothetical protein
LSWFNHNLDATRKRKRWCLELDGDPFLEHFVGMLRIENASAVLVVDEAPSGDGPVVVIADDGAASADAVRAG